MKKEDLLLLNIGLQKVLHLSGVKFAYAVTRNLALLKPEMESLENVAKPSEDYLKFEEERDEDELWEEISIENSSNEKDSYEKKEELKKLKKIIEEI